MIKCIFFDFWETLVVFDGETALKKMRWERAKRFKDALSQYKYDFSEADVFNALESVRLDCAEIRDTIHKEFHAKEVTKLVLQKLNINTDNKIITSLSKIYSKAILTMKLTLRDGTIEVLNWLRRRGIKVGLLSNSEHGTIEMLLLKRFKIRHYFDSITFSCDVGLRKPRIEIFVQALKSLNATPEESAHVGDWPKIDVLGAKRAGMKAIYVKARERPFTVGLPQPDATIEDLGQIPQLIENNFQ